MTEYILLNVNRFTIFVWLTAVIDRCTSYFRKGPLLNRVLVTILSSQQFECFFSQEFPCSTAFLVRLNRSLFGRTLQLGKARLIEFFCHQKQYNFGASRLREKELTKEKMSYVSWHANILAALYYSPTVSGL